MVVIYSWLEIKMTNNLIWIGIAILIIMIIGIVVFMLAKSNGNKKKDDKETTTPGPVDPGVVFSPTPVVPIDTGTEDPNYMPANLGP
jgi:flagellar basal body-associated protein FliL